MRICLVKQHTTYDLYTQRNSDLRCLVNSSNWRSGPLALWEAFDCDFRIVWENLEKECQIGKRHWSKYVEGWKLWPDDGYAESADEINWGEYNVVISIDIAIPKRIIKQFPQVMWCYYFIEGGPTAVDGPFWGSPFYGYNVFLNHRLSKGSLLLKDEPVMMMLKQRRAVLDFPYYLHSGQTIQKIYSNQTITKRYGATLNHHSYAHLSIEDEKALDKVIGLIRHPTQKISDIHLCELESKYFIVHPSSTRMAGLAMIESISAGCLALSPPDKIWGFPELVNPELIYSNFEQLLILLYKLEQNPTIYESARQLQTKQVNDWCFLFPVMNLKFIYKQFTKSQCTQRQHSWFNYLAMIRAFEHRTSKTLQKIVRLAVMKIRCSYYKTNYCNTIVD